MRLRRKRRFATRRRSKVEGRTFSPRSEFASGSGTFDLRLSTFDGLSTSKSSDGPAIAAANSPKRLDLVFVRDVDRDDIVEAFTDGFKKNGGDMAKLKDRIGQLNGWMPDLKKKDVLSFTYVPGTGLSVSVKGQAKGTIPGEDFQNSFFRIWLGPEPPNKGLKKGLLGQ